MNVNLSEYEDQECNFSEEIYHENQQQKQVCLELIRQCLNKTNNVEEIQTPQKQKEPSNKTKAIKKQSDTEKKQSINEKKKYVKRVKDPEVKTVKGRPHNNRNFEKQHLDQNKKYNDIVYHYARFLIFLKFNQGKEVQSDQIEFPSHLTDQINEATRIMNTDNYPQFNEAKPVFLLHPNSPHYVLSVFKSERQKGQYSSSEMLAILLAFLRKKKLLSESNYTYINDYWPDIIYLFNNPKGANYNCNIPQDSEERQAHSESYESDNEDENNNRKSNKRQSNQEQHNPKKSSKIDNPNSEYKLLQEQLKDDPTIIAYEIACYLHACSQRYKFKIHQ